MIKEIKVLDIKNNKITSYPSIRKAALAINEDVKSLNCHILSKSSLGLTTLYKDQYLITVESKKSPELSTGYCVSSFSNLKRNCTLSVKGKPVCLNTNPNRLVPKKSILCSRGSININTLELNKLYAYYPDKTTLAYVFNNIVEACRTLTPNRSKKFTDSELKKNKNTQFILRVINKGVLTKTEQGKFYLLKNPGYSSCLAIVL